MASRYWVGGGASTNWNATGNTNWSATSGGANNASVPGTGDDAIFDGSSGAGTSVMSASQSISSLDCTGFTGTLTLSASQTILVTGGGAAFKYKLVSGMTYNGDNSSSYVNFQAGSGTALLTFGGKKIRNITITAGSVLTLQFQDAGSVDTIAINQGTLDTQGFSCSFTDRFDSTGTVTRTVTLGASTLTFANAGYANNVWNCTGSGLTLTANTSTIVVEANGTNGRTFNGLAKTYNDVKWNSGSSGGFTLNNNNTFNQFWYSGAGTGALGITGSNTFTDFKVDTPPQTVTLTAATTQTVTTFTASGTAGNLITLQSATAASHAWAKSGGGTISSDYLSISRSDATPGTTWYAGANSTDGGNNTGWIFTTPPADNTGALSAAGAATGIFTGAAGADGALSGSAAATAIFAGAVGAGGALSAAGAATAAFTGATGAEAAGALAAAGTGTATFTGAVGASADLSVAGAATAEFVGNVAGVASADFYAAGSATAIFTGAALAAGDWDAAGSALAAFVGSDGEEDDSITREWGRVPVSARRRSIQDENDEIMALVQQLGPHTMERLRRLH